MENILLWSVIFLKLYSFDVFVSTSGSDFPECSSQFSPCSTLNYAYTLTIGTSDRVIYIGNGSFSHLNAYIGSSLGGGTCNNIACTGGPYKLSVYGESSNGGSTTITYSSSGVNVYKEGEFVGGNFTLAPQQNSASSFTLYDTGVISVTNVIFGSGVNRQGYVFLLYGNGVLTINSSSHLNGRAYAFPFIYSYGSGDTTILSDFTVRNVTYNDSNTNAVLYHKRDVTSTLNDNEYQFTLINSTISDVIHPNSSAINYGGVFAVSATIKPLTFINNTFNNVQAPKGYGGCISVRGTTLFSLTISFCSFQNVSGIRGAALWIASSILTEFALIESSLFQWCAASEEGGAIYSTGILLRVVESRFRNSHAGSDLAGIDIHYQDASLADAFDSFDYEGSCSYTDLRNFLINITDFSAALPHCSVSAYVASSESTDGIAGVDSEDCGLTFFTPCASMKMVLDLYSNESVKIIIHNGILVANPVVVNRAGIVFSINSFYAAKRNSTLRFNSSVTTAVPFFTVSNGDLALKDIKLIYNGDLKSNFIKVSGANAVAAIENCLVTSILTGGTLTPALYSFASVGGGGQLTVENSTSFRNVSLNDPAVLFLVEGNGSLTITTVEVTTLGYTHLSGNIIAGIILSSPLATTIDFQLTLNTIAVSAVSINRTTTQSLPAPSVNGTLFYIRNTSRALILNNVAFSDGDSTQTFFGTTSASASSFASIYGSVLYVGSASSLSIDGANFSNGGLATAGGAIVIEACASVVVTNSRFSNFSTTSDGGAIYFGTNVGFRIQGSVFSNCSSTLGNGGAIASASILRVNSNRGLSTLTFTNCSCSQNKGNDFADVASSNPNSHIGLYSPTGITSNSASIKFYIVLIDLDMDCLFTMEGCSNLVEYVDGQTGMDLSACGSQSVPCASFTVGYQHLPRGVLYIQGGSSYVHLVNQVLRNVSVIGVVTDGAGVEAYPKFRGVDSSNYVFTMTTPTNATFFKIYFIQNSPTAGRYILNQNAAGFSIFDTCVFSTDGISTSSGFLNIIQGNCTIVNSLFRNITTAGESPIFYTSGSAAGHNVIIRNTSFSYIRASGEYPAAFWCNETVATRAYRLYIYSSIFEHISGTNSNYGTVGSFYVYSITTSFGFAGFYNNSVTDVNTTGGDVRSALRIRVGNLPPSANRTRSLIAFQGNVFDTILSVPTNGANGACVSIIFPASYDFPAVISNSRFAHAEGARGGAIFFQPATSDQVIVFERVIFTSNTATVGGNDIYINVSSDASQYANNFIASCSSSIGGTIKNIFVEGLDESLDSLLGSCTVNEYYVSSSGSGSTCGATNPCNSLNAILTSTALLVNTYTTIRIISAHVESSSVVVAARFVTLTSSSSSSRSNFQYSSPTIGAPLFEIVSNGSLTLEAINVLLNAAPSGSFGVIDTGGRITISDVSFSGSSSSSFSNILLSVTNGSAYVYGSSFSGTAAASNLLTLAQTLFVGGDGGVLEISNSSFSYINTTADKSLLLVDNSTYGGGGVGLSVTVSSSSFTNISLSSSITTGGFVSYNGSANSSLYLLTSTFSNITIGGSGSVLLGGVVYGQKAGIISVSQSTFRGISGAKSGGALYFDGAGSYVDGSVFEDINTTDYGGALFFLSPSVPSITGGSFTSCRSATGGGAICFNLTSLTGTCVGITFGTNVANLGSNIIDISSTSEATYQKFYFVNCTQQTSSSSITNTFWNSASSTDYSCLINATCSTDTMYVLGSHAAARDFTMCGLTIEQPCETLSYAVNVAKSGEEIQVLYGNTSTSQVNLANRTIIITGIQSGTEYPVVHVNWNTTSPNGIFSLSSRLDDLRISYIAFELEANNQTTAQTFLWTQMSSADIFVSANLTDCRFNITGDKVFAGTHLVGGNYNLYGIYSFTRVVFEAIRLTSSLMFVAPTAYPGGNGTQTFDGCEFIDMSITTSNSLLYPGYVQNNNMNITITGCTLTGLSGSASGTKQGFAISLRVGQFVVIANNTFKDYDAGNSLGGAILISGNYGSLTIESNTFKNLTTSNAGVAIYQTSSTAGVRVVNCTFEDLKGIGAVYINNTVLFVFVGCSFIQNSGGDIYNADASTFASYTDETIRDCCSSSPSPKLVFSDERQKDFLLDLPCDIKIYFVSSSGVNSGTCQSSYTACQTLAFVLQDASQSYSVRILSSSFSVAAAAVGNRILRLEPSEVGAQTTVAYSGTLTINGGELAANDLNFTYGGGLEFANVQNGKFVFEYVLITGSTSSGPSTYPFIQASGESTVELVGVTFSQVRASAAIILFTGQGLFNLQESIISEVNFTGPGLFFQATAQTTTPESTSGIEVIVADTTFEIIQIASPTGTGGGVIQVNDNTGSIISVVNVEVQDITKAAGVSGNVNGGFMQVTTAALVEIISLTVNTLTNASYDGGVFYFSSVGRVQVTNSSFVDVNASHNGGALYFGHLTLFLLDRVVFRSNIAGNRGGAVFSISAVEGGGRLARLFSHIVFLRNTAVEGSDIADESQSQEDFYSVSNFVNVSSNSNGVQFFYKGRAYQCLFTRTCDLVVTQDVIYYVSSSSGSDDNNCQTTSSACLTFKRPVSLAVANNYTIILTGSVNITDTIIINNGKTITVSGGDTYTEGSVPPNSFKAVTGTDSAQTSFFAVQDGKLYIANLSITLAPPTPSTATAAADNVHSFVYILSEESRFTLTNATLTGGGTSLVIYGIGTSGTLNAVAASNLALDRYPLIVVQESCARFTIQFSNFTNVTGGSQSTGAVLNAVVGVATRLLVISSVFENVSSEGSGGAINASLRYSFGALNNFYVRNSFFSSCSSLEGDGGAIYLYLQDEEVDFVFAFTDISFTKNTVGPSHHGNDIYVVGFELRTIVSLSHFEGASFIQPPQDNSAIWGYDLAWQYVRNILSYVLTDVTRVELTDEYTLEEALLVRDQNPNKIYEIVVKENPYSIPPLKVDNVFLIFEGGKTLIDITIATPTQLASGVYINNSKTSHIEFGNIILPTVRLRGFPFIHSGGTDASLGFVSVKFIADAVVPNYVLLEINGGTLELDGVEVLFPSSSSLSPLTSSGTSALLSNAGLGCVWTSGAISLTDAQTTVRHSNFSNVRNGIFVVSGGKLTLDSTVKFVNISQAGTGYTTPPVPSRTGTCADGGVVDVAGSTFFDDVPIDSTFALWFSTPDNDCTVGPYLEGRGVTSLLFTPTLAADTPLVILHDTTPATLTLAGTNLFVCDEAEVTSLVMYELTADGEVVNEAALTAHPTSDESKIVFYADLVPTENDKWVELRHFGVVVGERQLIVNKTVLPPGGDNNSNNNNSNNNNNNDNKSKASVNVAAIVVPIVVVVVVGIVVIVVVIVIWQIRKDNARVKNASPSEKKGLGVEDGEEDGVIKSNSRTALTTKAKKTSPTTTHVAHTAPATVNEEEMEEEEMEEEMEEEVV